jgi:hypothetical protein
VFVYKGISIEKDRFICIKGFVLKILDMSGTNNVRLICYIARDGMLCRPALLSLAWLGPFLN